MIIGYARVSTTGQSLESQIEDLTAAGCEQIFSEKQSGKAADNREELQQALKFARDGDVLVITKLDRLARSMLDLSKISDKLKQNNVDLKVLGQPDLDTTSATGKLLFNIMGSMAEFERDLIKDRCAEGRAKAQKKGVKMGRKPSITEETKQAIRSDALSSDKTKSEIAKEHGVTRQTVYRILNEVV